MKRLPRWTIPTSDQENQKPDDWAACFLTCGTCASEVLSIHAAKAIVGFFVGCRACGTQAWTPDWKEFYDIDQDDWLDRAFALIRDRARS